ncbi:MAG: ribonuclease Y [Spirochaetes bacterium]|nr:ribonuclease Y [Spirochaetota bacterium]
MALLKILLPSLVGGIALGYILRLVIGRIKLTSAEVRSKKILEDAQRDAESKKREYLLEARDQIYKERNELEKELKIRREETKKLEQRFRQKEENIDKRVEILEKKENHADQLEKELKGKDENLKKEQERIQKQLEKISNLSKEEARKLFLENIQKEAKYEALKIATTIEDEAKRTAETKSQEIIANAIQRNASLLTSELSVTTVHLPNDEMKGRIIGREGRNIRTLENLTGVDIIIDDTPDTVVISGYDPMKREIAKIALEKLIFDGRIHPSRIEEIVENVQKNIDNFMMERGEQVIFKLGLQGIHSDVIKLIGKMNYRTSYGQNTLNHSIEVAHLCQSMAADMSLDPILAKRIGLLHDIGKCLSTESGDGSHAVVGGEFLKKYNENNIVINSIASHHGDRDPETVYAVLVQAADAISASRPGARKENIDEYVKRLESIEKIANGFDGVDKAYAIQAGREVRIIVSNDHVSDDDAKSLAKEIAKKIESELRYPGQVKVTLIRETRIIEYAR